MDSCQTEDETADRIIVSVRGLLKDFKLQAYDENTGRGFLRHVLVKRGFATGQVMVVLVTGTPVFTAKKHFVAKLRELHPEITTILQNVNDKRTSLVLGEREKVLYGPGYIVDELCGCRFRISAKSFYQINPVQTEVLYSKAVEFRGAFRQGEGAGRYCGIGTIGLVAAKHGAGQVLGVELNPDAVKDAIQNARENGMKNAWFTCGDAGAFLEEAALERERSLSLSPMLMQDMDKAVARIQRALSDGETIAVFGDYDVDGITSTVLLMDYLRRCGAHCLRYIPRRVEDGYGLSRDAIQSLRDRGATLMITVDCGITGNEEVAFAASLGMDVVVTDHHECKETLPAAVAVVDPHRKTAPTLQRPGRGGCGPETGDGPGRREALPRPLPGVRRPGAVGTVAT